MSHSNAVSAPGYQSGHHEVQAGQARPSRPVERTGIMDLLRQARIDPIQQSAPPCQPSGNVHPVQSMTPSNCQPAQAPSQKASMRPMPVSTPQQQPGGPDEDFWRLYSQRDPAGQRDLMQTVLERRRVISPVTNTTQSARQNNIPSQPSQSDHQHETLDVAQVPTNWAPTAGRPQSSNVPLSHSDTQKSPAPDWQRGRPPQLADHPSAESLLRSLLPENHRSAPRYVPYHVTRYDQSFAASSEVARKMLEQVSQTPSAMIASITRPLPPAEAAAQAHLFQQAAAGVGRLCGLLPATDILDRESDTFMSALVAVQKRLETSDQKNAQFERHISDLTEQIARLHKEVEGLRSAVPGESSSSNNTALVRVEQTLSKVSRIVVRAEHRAKEVEQRLSEVEGRQKDLAEKAQISIDEPTSQAVASLHGDHHDPALMFLPEPVSQTEMRELALSSSLPQPVVDEQVIGPAGRTEILIRSRSESYHPNREAANRRGSASSASAGTDPRDPSSRSPAVKTEGVEEQQQQQLENDDDDEIRDEGLERAGSPRRANSGESPNSTTNEHQQSTSVQQHDAAHLVANKEGQPTVEGAVEESRKRGRSKSPLSQRRQSCYIVIDSSDEESNGNVAKGLGHRPRKRLAA